MTSIEMELETTPSFLSLAMTALRLTNSAVPQILLTKHRKTITLDEVSNHDSSSSCWIIIYDRVYDVTEFLKNVSFSFIIYKTVFSWNLLKFWDNLSFFLIYTICVYVIINVAIVESIFTAAAVVYTPGILSVFEYILMVIDLPAMEQKAFSCLNIIFFW